MKYVYFAMAIVVCLGLPVIALATNPIDYASQGTRSSAEARCYSGEKQVLGSNDGGVEVTSSEKRGSLWILTLQNGKVIQTDATCVVEEQ